MKRVILGVLLAAACASQSKEQKTQPEPQPAQPQATANTGTLAPAGQASGVPAMNAPQRQEVTQAAAKQLPTGPGGIRILALPANQNAIVNVQLRFHTGAVDDPQGKAGLTYLTARVMSEGGTQQLTAKQLLDALFPLAAELDSRVDKEETTFSVRVHRDNLAKVLPILQDVLLHPRWDPSEFARLRTEAVNGVEKRLRQADDENLGKESLYELLYRGHPYGRLTQGHVKDLQSLTLADLQQQAKSVFTADRLTIGVSGGYPKDLPQQLAQALSALPAKSAAPVVQISQAQAHGPRFLLVEKNADSTAISMGFPYAFSRKNPDWAALSVARSAFGEHRQFNGRLMQRLREARGLNYGDYAYIEHFQQEGGDAATAQLGRPRTQQEFSIWVRPVKNENRLFATRAALYELQRSVTDEPFTAQEVEQTKGFLDGYILLFDQTDSRKLGYALDDAFYGMDGFLQQWHAAIRNVTVDQVNAAWRKWIDPAKVDVVLVGKGMQQVKQQILSNEPSPIQYQKDAQGNAVQKPPAQLQTDAQIEKLPFGAKGADDVQVVPVEQMFE